MSATLPTPAYPRVQAGSIGGGLAELFAILADRGISFAVEWHYPEPLQTGHPNRLMRLTIPSGLLTWASIDALAKWASASNGRDFQFMNGELVLTYRWIDDEEVEV